jgi:hypothetical protein
MSERDLDRLVNRVTIKFAIMLVFGRVVGNAICTSPAPSDLEQGG